MSVKILRDDKEPLIQGMVTVKPIIHRYVMPAEIESQIRSIKYRFGYGGFSQAVYARTYSRVKNDGKKEIFPDTIVRVVNGVLSIRKDWYITHGIEWNEEYWNKKALEMGTYMMELKLLPPGRGLFMSGSEFSYKRGSSAFNNCGFCSVAEGLTKAVSWTMDSLLNGCGIGFDTETNGELDTVALPGCSQCYSNLNSSCNCNKIVYIIHDSREGWVKSVYLLLESYFGRTNGRSVHFDYSEVRGKGVPIKGFGGISSGPEPLRILHERIRIFFKCFIEAKNNIDLAYWNMINSHIDLFPESDEDNKSIRNCLISSLSQFDEEHKLKMKKTYGVSRLICDIFNSIGICVVAGNVRRSSEIALSRVDDEEFLELKNYTLNPERMIIGWMSNNSLVMRKAEDFKSIPKIAQRIRDNGEPGFLNLINVNRSGRVGKRHLIGREAEPDPAIGINPCVTGDTLIQTSYGYRRVDQLIGQQFSAVINGQNYWSTKDGFWSSGIKDVFEVQLSNGSTIRLTSNHKVLVRVNKNTTEWKEIRDVKEKEKICLTENENYKWDGIGTFEEGYFCGQLIGDGTFSEGCPQICLWMKEDVNPLTHGGYILLENYARSLNPGPCFSGWRRTEVNNGYVKYVLQTQKFKEVTDKYGIFPLEKKIPEFCSYNFTIGLLRGFFDADGTVLYSDYLSVRLGQADLGRLEAVQRLLFSVGIFSSIYKNRKEEGYRMLPNGKGGNDLYFCKTQHELSCSGSSAKKYFDIVGFFEPHKNLKLHVSINSYTKGFYEKHYSAYIVSFNHIGQQYVYDCSIPGPNCFSAGGVILANCGEIPLESFEFCNLAEVFPSRCNNFDEMKKAAELATLYSSTISLLPTHWSYTNRVVAKNRRIGISLSGIVEEYHRVGFAEMTARFDELYTIIRTTNKKLADEAGVIESLRCTTIKPSGTISQLVGVPSGIHFNTYQYCIRRMRVSANSDIVPILKEAGYNYEPDVVSGAGTLVFEFPLYQGESRTSDNVSVWEQAALQAALQRCFADNSVSCTLYFNPETEGDNLEYVLAQFAPVIKSTSALPHTPSGQYPQMPYEKITKGKYEEMNKEIKEIDWDNFVTEEEAVPVRGCDGETCDIAAYRAMTNK